MNKKQVWIMALAFIGMLCFSSCEKYYDDPKIIHNAVKDYDGNRYDAVRIGRQVWMLTNLRTTHYADGTPIAAFISDEPIPGYYRIPGVDEATYGLLYNWYAAVRDTNNLTGKVQGICPKGWHVPSYEDWAQLTRFAGQYWGQSYEYFNSGYYSNNYDVYTNDEAPARALASQTGWDYYPLVLENTETWRQAMDSLIAIYGDSIENYYNYPSEELHNEYNYLKLNYQGACDRNLYRQKTHPYCPGANPANNNESMFSAVPAGKYEGGYDSVTYDPVSWEPSHWGEYSYKHTGKGLHCSFCGVEEYGKMVSCMSFSNGSYGGGSEYFGQYKTTGQSVRCVKD